MKIFVLLAIVTVGMAGCQSTHKLTYPKGKWQAINQAGFIPPAAKVYQYDLPSDDSQKQLKTDAAIDATVNESVSAIMPEKDMAEEVKQFFHTSQE